MTDSSYVEFGRMKIEEKLRFVCLCEENGTMDELRRVWSDKKRREVKNGVSLRRI